ncbi:hypothetical protein R3P38DRAFT_3230967 [Favolaschia claudopus]|uniref:Uncharacterized protein n=1 Tax=Favolaschia claudopus TaxID=2862362 RepID=A0AAV9ZLA9_9AGAR
MAEVLGIVTGVLQLLQTALKATALVNNVYKAIQEQQKILIELENIQPLLTELRLRILADPSQRMLRNMAIPLTNFQTTLEGLTRRLQAANGRFRWVFSEKKKMKEDLRVVRQFHDMANSWMILDFWDQIDGNNPMLDAKP